MGNRRSIRQYCDVELARHAKDPLYAPQTIFEELLSCLDMRLDFHFVYVPKKNHLMVQYDWLC
jgi:hypothetical protein